MTIGFIGLGKMGKAMALRLLKSGVQVVAYNRSADAYPAVKKAGAVIASSAQDVARRLKGKKIIWLMVPQGRTVDQLISLSVNQLKRGDIIIDGGNSNYLDSQRRAKQLKKRGIYFLDIGTSGGITGARDGWCFMAGGDRKTFKHIEPLLKIMSRPRTGHLSCGMSREERREIGLLRKHAAAGCACRRLRRRSTSVRAHGMGKEHLRTRW